MRSKFLYVLIWVSLGFWEQEAMKVDGWEKNDCFWGDCCLARCINNNYNYNEKRVSDQASFPSESNSLFDFFWEVMVDGNVVWLEGHLGFQNFLGLSFLLLFFQENYVICLCDLGPGFIPVNRRFLSFSSCYYDGGGDEWRYFPGKIKKLWWLVIGKSFLSLSLSLFTSLCSLLFSRENFPYLEFAWNHFDPLSKKH